MQLSTQDLAQSCVHFVQRALGFELDFTPETLPILDHYLASKGETDEAITELVVTAAGVYFGEVLLRHLAPMRWHLDTEDTSSTRLELEHVFLFFNPIGMVREAIVRREVPGVFAHLEVLPRDRGLLEAALERLGGVGEEDYYRLAVRYETIEAVVRALEAASIARKASGEVFPASVYEATARALREEAPRGPTN